MAPNSNFTGFSQKLPISRPRSRNRKKWLVKTFLHFFICWMQKKRLSISEMVSVQSLEKVWVLLKKSYLSFRPTQVFGLIGTRVSGLIGTQLFGAIGIQVSDHKCTQFSGLIGTQVAGLMDTLPCTYPYVPSFECSSLLSLRSVGAVPTSMLNMTTLGVMVLILLPRQKL